MKKIFSTYITLKDGTRIYAKDYGKRAFCFEAGKRKKPVKK